MALAAAIILCPLALADADPASDVLLGASVFYPYNPTVSNGRQKALNAETTAAARAHFPIKVALIDSAEDLGAIPSLFEKPQPYADFLDQELGFQGNPHPPLLVVMPDGYGVRGLPATATAAVVSMPKPAGTQSNELAQAAITAVRSLAGASGHPIPRFSDASGAGNSSPSAFPIAIVAIAAVAAAGGVVAFRRRLSGSR